MEPTNGIKYHDIIVLKSSAPPYFREDDFRLCPTSWLFHICSSEDTFRESPRQIFNFLIYFSAQTGQQMTKAGTAPQGQSPFPSKREWFPPEMHQSKLTARPLCSQKKKTLLPSQQGAGFHPLLYPRISGADIRADKGTSRALPKIPCTSRC